MGAMLSRSVSMPDSGAGKRRQGHSYCGGHFSADGLNRLEPARLPRLEELDVETSARMAPVVTCLRFAKAWHPMDIVSAASDTSGG
ncbi:MAG: hypothetical protein Fues2KO_37390 [Fuerstiella sp.]